MLALVYVALLATIAFGIPLGLTLRDRVGQEVRFQARSQVDVVAASAEDIIEQHGDLGRLARSAAHSVRGRVVVVDAAGRLLADSAGPARLGQSYAARPEIRAALTGHSFQQSRHSQTLGEDLLATAAPILHGGRPVGAVRVTQSVAALHRSVGRSVRDLVLVAGVVLLLTILVAMLIARRLARPLVRLDATAHEIADGDLDRRAPVAGTKEQRSLARSFNAMTERLSRALAVQRQFVADASHQLRTPLTGLRLRIEEAQATTPPGHDGEATRAELKAALDEVDRMSAMVSELLVLSSAGQRDAPAVQVDLGHAARAAVERWAGAASEHGVWLSAEVEGAGSAHCVRADLDRAIDSLVENALRYSPPGSRVVVVARSHAIEVLDDGPGLASDEAEQVFDRFHRGTAGRTGAPGTGLGLPIARQLARAWGGDAAIANRDGNGGGARATLAFPEEDAEA